VGYCDGGHHATEQEARECYRRYLLDTRLTLDREGTSAHKCLVCGEWTPKFATVGYMYTYPLCDAHRTREEVERRFPVPDQSVSSH
jgi:hypothetical protein